MTERERFLCILQGKQPDRIPWGADLSYYIHSLQTDGLYPEKYQDSISDDGLQAFHRDHFTGFYLQGYSPFQVRYENVEQSSRQEGSIVTKTVKTPLGDLREVTQYSAQSYSWGITEHFVKDIADLRKYVFMQENSRYTPDYLLAQNRYETIGDNGVVLCYMPKSPMMDLIALQAGIENVTYMLSDEEDEFMDLLQRLERNYDEACQLVLDSPAECIMIPENISSECVFSFYQAYLQPYHKKWTDRIREKGKYSFVHLDGTVKGLIHQLSRDSGFDVIEAVTPFPVGDVNIEDVANMVEPKTIIWGGIPGGFFTNTISDEEFDRYVTNCIRVMTKAPRYVLGVADQVVPGSSAQRIKRVRELVERFGRYTD